MIFTHPARRIGRVAESLQPMLPEGCQLLFGPADIELIVSGTPVMASSARSWRLRGEGETPFSRAGFAMAASRRHGLIELVLTEMSETGERLLGRAAFLAVPGNIEATEAKACDRAARVVRHALQDLLSETPPLLSLRVHEECASTRPSAGRRLALAWRRFCRRVDEIALAEDWRIGWIDAPIGESPGWTRPPKIEWIGTPSATRYLADPFALPGKDDVIYCEAFDRRSVQGHLLELTLSGNRILEELPVELPFDRHLSFPFLFSHAGESYCLPESSADRRLVLFRREGEAWIPHAEPLVGRAITDAVLFMHDGRFWIAFTDLDLDPFDNLNLCHADRLEGPWQLHPGNPVVLDPRCSRNGGTPFQAEGGLYRPAQDCRETYGGAIRIMKIVECSPGRYREEEVTRIAPEDRRYPDGFHTLSSWGARCLVDGKRLRMSPSLVVGKLWRRLTQSRL